MATERSASVVWTGDLTSGAGVIGVVGSGSFGPLDVTWAARSGGLEGDAKKTSPEELIAAAWAACFAMALSSGLAKGGTPPETLVTSATVTFQPGDGIVKGALTVTGTVPGLEQEAFGTAAKTAKENCPVSKALAGIPDVTLNATLQ
ncbi:MAG TPA: OsmC family peroxiredoxin [Gaiellaceae bacterium]|nr:OsmC family peroxiredoxin [Gaiellaceae bacterium]